MNIVEGSSIKQLEKEIENQMDKHIKHFEKEVSKLRTGRAHPSMVEDIRVSCYGTNMPIKEIASISAQDASLLVIQPWDKSLLDDIIKALSISDLNINPQSDGEIIRLKIPPMSSSRRDELVKSLHQKLEFSKIAIRNTRKDIQNKIREAEKSKDISEDYSKRLQDILQKTTDKFIKLSDDLATQKEGEIKNL